MLRKGNFMLSGFYIPQTDCGVPAATGEVLAIRRERHTPDGLRMPRKQGDLCPGLCMIEPNTDRTRHSNQGSIG